MILRVTHYMRRVPLPAFSIERLSEDIRGAFPRDVHVTVWTCRHYSKGLWPRFQDMWSARAAEGDINHVTGDVHYLTLLLDHKRTILTIHDLVSLGRLRGLKRWIFWLVWYWLSVRCSRAVVVISESTRRQLLESVRCAPEKVRVIHNCVSDEFVATPHVFNSGCPRILFVGTTPNKNLERVAEALAGIRCRLIVVGPLAPTQRDTLARCSIDYDNLVSLSRNEMLAQYIAADILLFASTYEGFGLPIVEANAVGRPVVTSNVSSMPEVAGDAACLVDPFDVASIRAGVRKIIDEESYRAGLIAAGLVNATRFTAAAVAAKYASLYREVAGVGTRRDTP